MIQHIKFFILPLLFFSCKEISEKKDNIFISQNLEEKNIEISKDDSLRNIDDLTGIWVCYKYTSDNSISKKYGENYAREFSTFSKFEINEKKIKIGECYKNIYSYKYPTALKKYDEESPFIAYFQPKKDSIYFIGPVNSGEDSNCDTSDNLTFYIKDKNNIIQNDRGYFFYYRKILNETKKIENCDIIGVSGNNRGYWNVECTLNQFVSIAEAYKYFLRTFPYGAENLVSEVPDTKDFLDKKNGIIYKITEGEFLIIKDDPMGKILISIKKDGSHIYLKYEMQYPDYD